MVQAILKNSKQSVSPLQAALKRTWLEFCDSSSIHGLKYTQDRDTNKFVRSIWMVITLIMFICAILMVINIYLDYRSNPTRLNIEKNHAPIESLTFPAVTICPETTFNVEQSKKYLGELTLPAGINVTQIIPMLSTSQGFLNDDDVYNETHVLLLQSIQDLNNLSTLSFMKHLHWNCEDIIFRCRFKWQTMDCKQLLQLSRTFFGYCCSFNLNQNGLNYTAQHARAGLFNGLSLILQYNDTDYGEMATYSDGFKVLISENDAFPSAHSIIKFVPLHQETFFSVRPIETYCSRDVKELSVDQRQCVLPHEFPLKHFEQYVGMNCELECRVQNMLAICGCVTYFFYVNDTAERVCSFRDVPCLRDNFAAIIGRSLNMQFYCPNTCEIIDFNVELTNAELNIDIPTVDDFYNNIQANHTVVHIFMNNQVYRRARRDLLSNMVTLVSNLGSAFSLFVGVSMISIVEVIYYLTVVLRKHYVEELEMREKLRKIPINWYNKMEKIDKARK
ncbi:sodium channel protein Nach [Ceratitis capitata]|uniref:sodium channel protein Nach n=1 Tax=Ceratitis capitata TaxID=7213 RepID=UPI000329BEF2|nr:sodium channel protein Nach [Ceratitis capitata]